MGLDRRHSRSALVKLSLAEFMTEDEYHERRLDSSMRALLAAPPLLEETSDVWINVRVRALDERVYIFFGGGGGRTAAATADVRSPRH